MNFEVVILLSVNFERMILVESVMSLDFAMQHLTTSLKSNNISQYLTTCLLAFVKMFVRFYLLRLEYALQNAFGSNDFCRCDFRNRDF